MFIPAGSNLQAILNAAAPGDILEPEAGTTWLGNYTIPATSEGAPIQVIGNATIRTPNALPALRTVGRAAGWEFLGLTFAAGSSTGDIVQLGDGLINDVANLPRGFVLDSCTIAADSTAKRGLQMNAADVKVRHCTITGVKLAGVESQAMACWNGPGPFLIEDCYIEAGSIGVLFGGAPPAIPNLTPSDITFRRNVVTRPLAMRGGGWAVKNLFELKHAKRASVTGNIFEHNWPDAQSGWAIVLTVRANHPTAAPWSTIQDVDFSCNVVRRSAMGFNILGLDNQRDSATAPVYQSTRMRNVTIQNNLLYEIDHFVWGGTSGAAFQVFESPEHLSILSNTVVQTGNILNTAAPTGDGFRFVGNAIRRNRYGISGSYSGEITANVIGHWLNDDWTERAPIPSQLPTGNFYPPIGGFMGMFTDPAAGNYRQTTWPGVGCDQDEIEAAQQPPVEPPPDPEPTLAEIIAAEAEACLTTCAGIGGDVSPQGAASNAVLQYRDALLARVAE